MNLGVRYRNIWILDSRNWFAACRDEFDPINDLVLTYDLGLKREIEGLGGTAFYVDHLVDDQVMQKNNFLVYDFFREWYLDADGRDLFSHKGVPFGFSFRLELWNAYVFYIRARLCLERLKELQFASVFAGTELGLVEAILTEIGIRYSPVARNQASILPQYYFPIHAWMSERIRRRGLKARVLNLYTWIVGSLLALLDRVTGAAKRSSLVFIEIYHPTRELARRLRRDSRIRLVTAFAGRQMLWSRFVPLWGSIEAHKAAADELMKQFRQRRRAKLVLTNGVDVSEAVYRLFERKIEGRVAESIRVLEGVQRYLDRNPVALEVIIATIGEVFTLVHCACTARKIPSYLILNGQMGNPALDEGTYATVINGYSEGIKADYFHGAANVVCLGDPRMDAYPPLPSPRAHDPDSFTVTIGASGHNNMDLNSFVAVEFEFMHDILQALHTVKQRGARLRVVIKVRANGYPDQYRAFTEEYFPGFVDEILGASPMKAVLERTDFYISFYSQSLFEASCMGIPCLYYKKDKEALNAPFDGRSELVTARDIDSLVKAIEDFRRGHERFQAFLERTVMEKYIGPLDGRNVERNLQFVHELLNQNRRESVN